MILEMSKPLVINIPADLEQRLEDEATRRGISLAEYTLEILQHQSPENDRRAEAVGLLQSWIDEEALESTESDDFLRSLDEDRPSERKLFPPELKGITW